MAGGLILPGASRPEREPGVPAAMRRLARLSASDVSYDQSCAEGRYHGKVDAQVGRATKTFDAHGAESLAALLDGLADAIEAERRDRKRRR